MSSENPTPEEVEEALSKIFGDFDWAHTVLKNKISNLSIELRASEEKLEALRFKYDSLHDNRHEEAKQVDRLALKLSELEPYRYAWATVIRDNRLLRAVLDAAQEEARIEYGPKLLLALKSYEMNKEESL